MNIPEEYIGLDEQSLIDDNKTLVAMVILGYTSWREGLSKVPRLKKAFVITSLFLIAKNASAIEECIRSGHPDSARALLRVNVEIYINILYVYTKPHNEAYIRLGYSSEMLYLSNINKYEEFTNATYTSEKLTADDFETFRAPFQGAKRQWERLNHGKPIKNAPDLRTRTEEIKKKLGIVWASELYYNSYLFLSEDVHATPSSIIGLASRDDFDEMWFGVKKYKSIRDTMKIQNEILASTMYLLKKKGFKFDALPDSKETVLKYNRHKAYKHFIG